jgi:hypothetical protein
VFPAPVATIFKNDLDLTETLIKDCASTSVAGPVLAEETTMPPGRSAVCYYFVAPLLYNCGSVYPQRGPDGFTETQSESSRPAIV